MSKDNFWLGVMLGNYLSKKQEGNNQEKMGCLSSLLWWFLIITVISIIGSIRRALRMPLLKLKITFRVHPVLSWMVFAVVLLLIIFCISKIIKHRKAKKIQRELEAIAEEEIPSVNE